MIVIDTNVVIEYLKGNEIIIQTVNEYSKKLWHRYYLYFRI